MSFVVLYICSVLQVLEKIYFYNKIEENHS